MWPRMPEGLDLLYAPCGAWVRSYVWLRWRLCPFALIAAELPEQGLVVDVGCGYGLLANLLALRSPKSLVHGIDRSGGRIAVAQRTVGTRDNVRFLRRDLDEVELPCCAAVVATDVLHHLSFPLQARLLERIYAALEPGGRLVLLEVDRQWGSWKYWYVFLVDRLLNVGATVCHSAARDLMARARGIGFHVQVRSVDHHLPFPDVLLVCRKGL